MGFAIGAGVLFLLMLAVLELNKNTLLGFALAIAAAALFVFVHGRAANGGLRFLCWIGWIALFALILFATWPPVRAIPAVEGESAGATEIVTLKNGQVQGVLTADGAVEVFTGIPYADPPVGELRWREPQDVTPWDGVRVCDHFAPMSMQPTNLPIYDSLSARTRCISTSSSPPARRRGSRCTSMSTAARCRPGSPGTAIIGARIWRGRARSM